MPKADRVQQQVFAAIAESGLKYRKEEDYIGVLAPPLEGSNESTAVFVTSKNHDNGKVVVYMFAPVVGKLPLEDAEIIGKALMICNDLNQDQIFGRWVYYPDGGRIAIEHELVGEDLDPSEVIGTVVTVAHSADRWDEKIQSELGAGERLNEEDFDGPVS